LLDEKVEICQEIPSCTRYFDGTNRSNTPFALSVVSTYNPNLTPLSTEDDNKNIVNVKTMYITASNYKEMFTEMNKFEDDLKNNNKWTNEIESQIDDAANKFTVDIQVTSYKLAKMAGRESQNTFSTFTNEFCC